MYGVLGFKVEVALTWSAEVFVSWRGRVFRGVTSKPESCGRCLFLVACSSSSWTFCPGRLSWPGVLEKLLRTLAHGCMESSTLLGWVMPFSF